MDKKTLLDKIEREERLSLVEQAQVEDLLENDPSHKRIVQALQELPHDTPSMEWRSRLNERLLKERRYPSKRFAWNRLGWALSTAVCASIIAVVVVTRNSPVQPDVPVVSANTLIQWHEEAKGAAALPADGACMSTFAIAEDTLQRTGGSDDLLYDTSLESL